MQVGDQAGDVAGGSGDGEPAEAVRVVGELDRRRRVGADELLGIADDGVVDLTL